MGWTYQLRAWPCAQCHPRRGLVPSSWASCCGSGWYRLRVLVSLLSQLVLLVLLLQICVRATASVAPCRAYEARGVRKNNSPRTSLSRRHLGGRLGSWGSVTRDFQRSTDWNGRGVRNVRRALLPGGEAARVSRRERKVGWMLRHLHVARAHVMYPSLHEHIHVCP